MPTTPAAQVRTLLTLGKPNHFIRYHTNGDRQDCEIVELVGNEYQVRGRTHPATMKGLLDAGKIEAVKVYRSGRAVTTYYLGRGTVQPVY